VFCLSVSLNGEHLLAAGVADGSFVDVTAAGSVFGDAPAYLRVAGMRELPEGRSAHVYWMEDLALVDGDVLTIAPVELPSGSAPSSIVPTDSPKYIEEQRDYQAFLEAHLWPRQEPVRQRGNLTFVISSPGYPTLHASLGPGQEHLMCGAMWNMWRPERTRVLARSFSGGRKLEWLRGEIPAGGELRVEMRA
jgi:hypothetical protein